MKAVKKQTQDLHQARALVRESRERLHMAKMIASTQKQKYVLENAYESIREFIDAIMIADGYKSYSHEASVAYLLQLGFPISDAMNVDRLRKLRNGIKYYGEDVTNEEAGASLKIAEEMIKKLAKKRPNIEE